MPTPHNADPYRRRREAGAESRRQTQQRLLGAAGRSFQALGYAATTVSSIAKAAGVSLQTLYLAWGSKREVFQAAAAAAAADTLADDATDWAAAVRDEVARTPGADGDTRSYLRAVSKVFTAVTKRTARYRQLYQEAAQIDPAIAQDW